MRGPEFLAKTESSIPPEFHAPQPTRHPTFTVFDYAVTTSADGAFSLSLIELQGGPSINALALLFDDFYRRHLPIPAGQTAYPPGVDRHSAETLFARTVLGDHRPENVVLTEIAPEQQGGYIDQLATCRLLGIPLFVPIDEVRQRGRKLFYLRDGNEIPIHRLYNRCVPEDIAERGATLEFAFTDDLDVEWADHPDWFYRISKVAMPLLGSPYVPETRRLSDFADGGPTDLDHWILKPTFGHSSQGVIIHPTPADLAAIRDSEDTLLQRRIEFATAFQTPAGPRKIEARVMLLSPDHDESPTVVSIKPRVFAGDMSNEVRGSDSWVGSTITYFPE